MKRYLIGIVCLVIVFSLSLISGESDLESQKKIAIDYFVKLTGGDIEAADELITIPYTLDLKKVLKTKEEVYGFHKKALESKGKRDIPEYTCELTKEAPKLDPNIFPPYTPFRVKIKGHGHLDIYVTNTKDPKVMGFTD